MSLVIDGIGRDVMVVADDVDEQGDLYITMEDPYQIVSIWLAKEQQHELLEHLKKLLNE